MGCATRGGERNCPPGRYVTERLSKCALLGGIGRLRRGQAARPEVVAVAYAYHVPALA